MYNIFLICEHLLVNANNAKIIVCCSGEHHWCYERDRNCFGEDEKGNLVDKNRFLCLSVIQMCVWQFRYFEKKSLQKTQLLFQQPKKGTIVNIGSTCGIMTGKDQRG